MFASASVDAALERPQRAPRPAKPTTAFSTTSGSASSSKLGEVAADLDVLTPARPRARRVECEPDASAQSSSSGWRSMTSSAWRPIEPVAPRRATRFMAPVYGHRADLNR